MRDGKNAPVTYDRGKVAKKLLEKRRCVAQTIEKRKDASRASFCIFMLEGLKGASCLFPFDSCRRLARDVVHHAGDTVDLVDDAV